MRIGKIGPPGAPSGYSHPRCYMAPTRNCSEQISREHFISASLLREFPNNTFVGLPWDLETVRRLPVAAVVSNVLCTRHNSGLSTLDDHALSMFRAVRNPTSYVTRKSLARTKSFALVSGATFQLWGLKTLLGQLHAKMLLGHDNKLLTPGDIKVAGLVAMLDSNFVPPGLGLYVARDQSLAADAIGFMPLVAASTNGFAGLRVIFCGTIFDFVLTLARRQASSAARVSAISLQS